MQTGRTTPGVRMASPGRLAIIAIVFLSGCEAATVAPVSPEVAARADRLRSLLEMETAHPEDYRDTISLLDLFRIELRNSPYPDTGATSDEGRRRTRRLHQHSLTRAFLAGAEGHPFYHLIQAHVAERMLKDLWMTRVGLDSLDAFYLEQAIAGLSPDVDRIIRTLDRLDRHSADKSRLATEALVNLEAYRLVLADSRAAKESEYGFRLNGESVTVEQFLDAVPANVASLQMIAADR